MHTETSTYAVVRTNKNQLLFLKKIKFVLTILAPVESFTRWLVTDLTTDQVQIALQSFC